jgi:predicted transcriptional regulator of viral defense system
VLKLAATQHWLIIRDQLLDLGLSRHALDRRSKSGFLVSLSAGIYRVAGAPQSWRQGLLGACLWAPGAASHRSALRLHGIDGYSGEIVEVTSTAQRASGARAHIHQTSSLPASDVMRVDSIPTTGRPDFAYPELRIAIEVFSHDGGIRAGRRRIGTWNG